MAAVSTTAEIPSPLNLTDRLHQGENWKSFRREWKFYELAAGIHKKQEEVRVASLLNVIGKEGMDMYDTSQWANASDALKIDKVLEKFEERCVPARNETYERYVFFKREQLSSESLDNYITALMKLSESCGFGALRESLVRDRLILGVKDDRVREKLLGKRDLDLDKAIETIKASQVTHERATEISEESSGHEDINRVSHKPPFKNKRRKTPPPKLPSPNKGPPKLKECLFCGGKHALERKLCPASGQKCKKCGKQGHFAVKCHGNSEGAKVHMVEEEFYIHSFGGQDQALVSLTVNDSASVTFQIDTGSTANILPLQDYIRATNDHSKAKIVPKDITLVMHDLSRRKALGFARMKVEHNGSKHELNFVIVDQKVTPLLGLQSSKGMGLIKIMVSSADTPINNVIEAPKQDPVVSENVTNDSVLSPFVDVFQGIGCLPGEYNIQLSKDVHPVVHPPRRVPVPKKEAMKTELDKMVAKEIITPVTEPTDWVSSVLAVPKKDGSVRICLDPKDLNTAIKRSHYPLPTVEDITTRLTNAKVFSVFDAKSGFWQVKLTEQSSFYTTFNTPFGRFRWLRMPFGISSAPEIWQRKMHEAIEGLQGVEVIADDFLVCGFGDTVDEAVKDHDQNLTAFLQRCRKLNLTLNLQKVKLRLSQVPFMGHLLTADGVVTDPNKVRAIRDMPTPTDVKSLKRFLGMVTYLAKFLPNLSSVCEPLRRLELKNTEWCWLPVHDEAVQSIKNLVCKAPVLKFYDVNQEVTIESDASLSGLGASLLQEGQPVAFASRALTPAEGRYAQIEKELLSVVFACERFDTYLFGRDVVHVKRDHQPLEAIFKKDLGSAPKRLQRMLLRLQRYNLEVKYQKGSSMVMSDPLSRAYLDEPPTQTEYCSELEAIILTEDLPISEARLMEFKEGTASDENLQTLMSVVLEGWPSTPDEVPAEVKPYFQFRDEITAQNGLLFKAERLIVPAKLRKEMMEMVHSSHLGIEGCLRRAREVFYWPRMNAELKDFILKCDICNSFKPEQHREPLMPHEIPSRPWQKVGTDMFFFDGRQYLITVDYYSSFFEVDKLDMADSRTVIAKLKMHFSRHGIPEVVISDNGPQYSSAEFAKFANDWHFQHITSSPRYPQSNGKVESAVKICENLMKKAACGKFDPYLALLDYRNTPTEIGSSPAQRLFSRRTRNLLPLSSKQLQPNTLPPQAVQDKLINSKQKQAFYYNLKGKALPELQPGQTVRMKKPKESTWTEAVCKKMIGPRSYVVVSGGQTYRRNRRQLRSVPQSDSPAIVQPAFEPLRSLPQADSPSVVKPAAEPLPVVKPSAEPPSVLKPAAEHVELASNPTVTRSGRIVKPPARFQDFTT